MKITQVEITKEDEVFLISIEGGKQCNSFSYSEYCEGCIVGKIQDLDERYLNKGCAYIAGKILLIAKVVG